MKTFTIEDIRSWKPCYPPEEKLPEGWSGNALDILRDENISTKDAFWVVLREEVLDAKTLRLFAVACARRVQHLMEDARSLKALDVAEAFAYGRTTKEELHAAEDAASDAAWAAESDSAWFAWAARAAESAAESDAAKYAARYAAEAAASDAERSWQRAKLIEMLEDLK